MNYRRIAICIMDEKNQPHQISNHDIGLSLFSASEEIDRLRFALGLIDTLVKIDDNFEVTKSKIIEIVESTIQLNHERFVQ